MGLSSYSHFLSFTLYSFAIAYPDGPTNGTSRWAIVEPGWAPAPSNRGTMDIVWSCLVTIFACSWTVTHPNFPGCGVWGSDSKIKMCLIAVLAPEVLAMWAAADYLEVEQVTRAVNDVNMGHFNYSQAYFVDMGGIQLEFADGTKTLGKNEFGYFVVDVAVDDLRRALLSNIFTLDSISVKDVRNRTKTSYIFKAVVCFQASWLVVQVIGRAAARIPTTSLEVVTVGYVACALTTYIFWWHKPQDAEVPIRIGCKSMTKREFHQKIAEVHISEMPNFVLWKVLSVALLPTVFGAIHCTAWNFYFASYTEEIIWRVASILTTVLPLLTPIFFHRNDSSLESVWWLIAIIPYALVRLYLMVEPFVAFRRVPQGIFYTVNWAQWVPHI